jgi:hypothetical protein
MIMNRTNNNLSVDAWTELKYLYSDLCGYELEKLVLNANDDVTKQNTSLKNYVSRKNTLNINWVSFENGSNGYSCRRLDSSYEWLLSQGRQSEIAREKLDLNKPFELAETQDTSSDRKLHFTQTDGSPIYFMTGKTGAGTRFYNSCWLNTASIADAVPGWLPENLNWQTGVESANILGVTQISDTAVAIEYDKDMTNVVIHLKGDEIIGTDGNVRKDIKYEVSPYDFYDNDGNYIECTIKNVYVNSSKNTRTGAAKCSGSGNFIIVEFEKAVTKNVVGVAQRTTVITDKFLASASHIVHKYDS